MKRVPSASEFSAPCSSCHSPSPEPAAIPASAMLLSLGASLSEEKPQTLPLGEVQKHSHGQHLTEESVSAESMKEDTCKEKSGCRFTLSESCLPSLQSSASVPVLLHFLFLLVMMSCPPATKPHKGDSFFFSQL